MFILMVPMADRVILALLGGLITSPSEKLKRYYALPYLPDAISDNSSEINPKWPERSSVKLIYRISGSFQLIQLTFSVVTVWKGESGVG